MVQMYMDSSFQNTSLFPYLYAFLTVKLTLRHFKVNIVYKNAN